MRVILEKTFAALASYGMTIVVLSFMFLITVIGTLEQTHSSLFEVQQRYFEAAFVIHDVAGVPVPLPGVYLLLVVLTVNIVCGGLIRIRKDKTTWGVVVAHLGILTMIAGAGVEFYGSQKGQATIAEGSSASEFVSYYEWEIAVAQPTDDGAVEEFVIPGHSFMGLAEGARAVFTSPKLPFDLVVHDVAANCAPTPAGTIPGARAVEGFTLVPLKRNKEAEGDLAGAYVDVVPKSGGAPIEGLLWGYDESLPMSVAVDGKRWTIDLSHRRFQMPFTVRLDDFRREMHPGPGVNSPKSFESDVTKIQNGVPQKVKISMNEPLLSDGVKVFQSGFQEPRTSGGRWFSTFSVVRNPADKVPLIACIVITVGLLLHFSQKLVRHVRTQTWRRA